MKKSDDDIPEWIRYLGIIVAIAYLLWLLFIKRGPQREDFPFFRSF